MTRAGERHLGIHDSLRWSAGQVASCGRDDLPIDHSVAGIHIIVRCSCGCAFQSTDASIAFGQYQQHVERSHP